MATRDWNKLQKEKLVQEHGSERNEFPDLTKQIAISKGRSRLRGPLQVRCPRCDEYIPEADRAEHIASCDTPRIQHTPPRRDPTSPSIRLPALLHRPTPPTQPKRPAPQPESIPAETLTRIKTKLERRALSDVLRICSQQHIPASRFGREIDRLIDDLYRTKSYGVILSAYYEYGHIAGYTVEHLLTRMFEAGDYPSFLKQALRFGFYDECSEQIEAAIAWHRDRKLPDAEAWARKFSVFRDTMDKNTNQ